MRRRQNSESGIATLTITIIMVVVLTITSFIILRISQGFSAPDLEAMYFYSTADIIKSNIYTLTTNPTSWGYTQGANSGAGLNCIGTASCPASYINIKIYDATNALVYDPTVAANGFSYDGTPCATFTTNSFNGNCVTHVDVKWRPFCNAGCQVPPNKAFVYLDFTTAYDTAALRFRGYRNLRRDRVNGIAHP